MESAALLSNRSVSSKHSPQHGIHSVLSKDTPSQPWQTRIASRATITEIPRFLLHFDRIQPHLTTRHPSTLQWQMNMVNSSRVTDISVVYWKEVPVIRQVFLNQLFLVNSFTLMLTTAWQEMAIGHGFIMITGPQIIQLNSPQQKYYLQSKHWCPERREQLTGVSRASLLAFSKFANSRTPK